MVLTLALALTLTCANAAHGRMVLTLALTLTLTCANAAHGPMVHTNCEHARSSPSTWSG